MPSLEPVRSTDNAQADSSSVAPTAPLPPSRGFLPNFQRNAMWSYFGPAFVASVAYIDPGNFATNILGGTQFGYRLLWVLLWSNAMAMLIQYLSAKLGIVTGLTLPQNCRRHFSRPVTLGLWAAAEIAAVATDLAEFLGAAIGLDLLFGPILYAHGFTPKESLLVAALVSTVLVFAILALDLAGFRWLERGIMAFVAIIGVAYAFEIFLVHPDWKLATIHTLLPTLDRSSAQNFHDSIYAAVAMLGATVMPHVVYLHSALVQPRLKELTGSPTPAGETLQGLAARNQPTLFPRRFILSRFLKFELIDVFVAMNGAWLINSAMILMAAVAFVHTNNLQPTIQEAYHTLGPLFGRAAAVVFAVALLCSGLSSSTVVLVVNTASECGYTPQYAGLEALFLKYKPRGLTVVGFPCNQFGGQEPGTAAVIKKFCTDTYNVTFPLFDKIEVNGPQRHPLYALLAGPSSPFPGDITWNFNKFLVGPDGKILARFDFGGHPGLAGPDQGG